MGVTKQLPVQCEPNIAGTIKDRPEDFIVDEIPLYEPCGTGEHLYFGVRKTNMSHDALMNTVARAMGVSTRAIGYAGRKDSSATTTQVLSVHIPCEGMEVPTDLGGAEIVWQSRHTNKLRLGHLLGNRFEIRIRGVDTKDVELIQDRLQQLSVTGLPNTFGHQRFGTRKNNHNLGKALLLEDWDLLFQLLDDGDEEFARGAPPRHACSSIPKPIRRLWVNALQSTIFNAVLQQRVIGETWDKPLVGDLICKHGARGRTFEATAEDIDSEKFQSRVASIEVSPTVPLWGKKMREPTGDVFEQELAVLHTFGLDQVVFCRSNHYGTGARRPLRVPVANTRVSDGIDAHGSFVLVQFSLPAGSYATVVIELLLNASP